MPVPRLLLFLSLSCGVLTSPVADAGAAAAVIARVEGLALGTSLELALSDQPTTATLNGPVVLGTAAVGSALAVEVRTQPRGQVCGVSDRAPALVPADSAPVFVRCRHVQAPRITVPFTLPDAPLTLWQNGAGLRTRAYPGLPYESRPGLRGGQFPYEFRLLHVQSPNGSLASSNVLLDFRRGTLRFTPPQAGEYRFLIEVRDSGATQRVLEHEFSVVADTASFLFVAPTGSDLPGRGAIDQPLRTIGFALSQSNPGQVLMLRKGRYAEHFQLVDARARQVLAFPDEVVEIDQTGLGGITLRFDTPPVARLEGLDIFGARQYSIVSDPSRPGVVLRGLRFRDAVVGNASENPAFVHGWGDGSPASRHRFLVQDTEFGSYPGGYAATLFDAGDSIVENNQVRLGASSNGLHDKDNSQRNVYRENYIEYAPEFRNVNGIQISAQANSEQVHIHHNLIVNSGILLGGQCFEPNCYMREHDLHHNTLVNGAVVLRWGVFNTGSRDTRIQHTLISNAQAPYAWVSCMNAVPAAFVPQLRAGANRLETVSANAMRDTECSGSPMNMSWATWRGTHGLDTVISGSVLSASSDLIGDGALTRLPDGDPRQLSVGHRYPLPPAITLPLFGNGFE